MTRARLSAVVRRLWPRRMRTRLAVFYALLFLLAGVVLLALTYTLAGQRAAAGGGAGDEAAHAAGKGAAAPCASLCPPPRLCSRNATT